MELAGTVITLFRTRGLVLEKPEFRPTEKQLLSSLKATERTAVGLDSSSGGRVFMLRWYRLSRG